MLEFLGFQTGTRPRSALGVMLIVSELRIVGPWSPIVLAEPMRVGRVWTDAGSFCCRLREYRDSVMPSTTRESSRRHSWTGIACLR